MADNTNKEQKNDQVNIENCTPNTDTNDIKSASEVKKSEVKKNWKKYFWDFFMLFLAVFCGFLAQWQLENILDKETEKDYITLLIKELENDNEQINAVYKDTIRNNQLDDFVIALANIDKKQSNVKNAYLLAGNVVNYDAMIFNRSTLSQLKNGGNMRLIRNQAVIDSISLIDNSIDITEKQLKFYESFIIDGYKCLTKILDYRYYLKFKSSKNNNFVDYLNQQSNVRYLNNNEELRIEFAAQVDNQKSVFNQYLFTLQEHQKLSKRVIMFIKKEYNLK